MLAFLLSKYVKTVYAVEPIGSFRHFIREKAKKEKVKNLYPIDGFLDLIPLPDNSLDILFTSNAIGWNLEAELIEVERVVKPGGQVINLIRNLEPGTVNPFHDILISEKWKYTFKQYGSSKEIKIKYSKIVK